MLKDIAKIKVWSGLIVRGIFLVLILYIIYLLNQKGWPVISFLGLLLGLLFLWHIFLMVMSFFKTGIVAQMITFRKEDHSALLAKWNNEGISLIGRKKNILSENLTVCLKTRFLFVDTYHLFFLLDGFPAFMRLKFFRGRREGILPFEKYALLPGSFASWKYSFWKNSLHFKGIKNRRSKWLNNFVELYLNRESRKFDEKEFQLVGGGILLDWRHMRDSIRAIGIKKFTKADPQRVAQLEMAVETEWPWVRLGVSGEDIIYSFCKFVIRIPLTCVKKIHHKKGGLYIEHDVDDLPRGIVFTGKEDEIDKWVMTLPQEKMEKLG